MAWWRRSVAATAFVAVGVAVVTGGQGAAFAAGGQPAVTAPAEDAPPRQGFAVEPFRNVQGIGALQHLTYGLPALIAERFAQAAPLRFAGRPELFSRTPPAGARWLVRGTFERRADWNVAVTVEIRAAAAPDQVAARATQAGARTRRGRLPFRRPPKPSRRCRAWPLTRPRRPGCGRRFPTTLTRSSFMGAGWAPFTAAAVDPREPSWRPGTCARAAGRADGPRDPALPGRRAPRDGEAGTRPAAC